MSPAQKNYFTALKIDFETEPHKLGLALDRAYELRTFEIEHYWKRATYFWGFQVAIFAASGLLWREMDGGKSGGVWTPIVVLLCGLGVLTAVANLLSARASKFWQKNWERHIDALEEKVEGNLHKTIWLRGGKVRFSVSRLNEALAWSMIVFWGLVFVYLGVELCGCSISTWLGAHYWWYFWFVFLLVSAGIVFLLSKRTDLKGTLPKDGEPGTPIRVNRLTGRVSAKAAPTFVLRYAPDEEPPE